MRALTLICCLVLGLGPGDAAKEQSTSDFRALYKAHNWSDLGKKLDSQQGALPLYRGAVGVVFNQDFRRTEKMLKTVISSEPHSEQAYEAYEWLSHLYFARGQYQSLMATMEKRWAEFPGKSERQREQVALAGFRGLPNQEVEKVRPSRLKHESETIFIPISVNGRRATYFFDTGAWASCLSESEAKRLGLKIREGSGQMGTMTGAPAGFRTAVAREILVGENRIRNVSFLVFPDNEEPWSVLPSGRRGIIGMPILLGLRSWQWHRDGIVDVGGNLNPFDISKANLMFDNDHLVVAAAIQGRRVLATLDTGAETTDLYSPFATEFTALLKKAGTKGTTEVRGVGHAESFESVTIPELTIQLGGFPTRLTPAHVLLKPIGAKRCVGNFGMDLLKQAFAFDLNFGSMTLQLESVEKPRLRPRS